MGTFCLKSRLSVVLITVSKNIQGQLFRLKSCLTFFYSSGFKSSSGQFENAVFLVQLLNTYVRRRIVVIVIKTPMRLIFCTLSNQASRLRTPVRYFLFSIMKQIISFTKFAIKILYMDIFKNSESHHTYRLQTIQLQV